MTRHYVITLQRSGSLPIQHSTQHGPFTGDDSEHDAFAKVWRTCCERLTEATGLDWTTENTSVLFYRLVPDAAAVATIAVTDLRPGDTLIFTADHPLSEDEIRGIFELTEKQFPDVKVAVVADGVAVSVLRPEASN